VSQRNVRTGRQPPRRESDRPSRQADVVPEEPFHPKPLHHLPLATARCDAICSRAASASPAPAHARARRAVAWVVRTTTVNHTTRQNCFSPGTSNGGLAPAFATIPVPITEAYQLGPRYLDLAASGCWDERTPAATRSLVMTLLVRLVPSTVA
jgi:hypothetical protein